MTGGGRGDAKDAGPNAALDVLAFEPWDGGSHRAVRESIERHSRHRWRWMTRPARAWKWRMRLAAIEMLEQASAEGAFDVPADVLFVTSLMSSADLRALLPPAWRTVPLVLSMHENQAAYPAGFARPHWAERDAHFPLTNLASILAADVVVWNSRHNLDSFLEGIGDLLGLAPDGAPADIAGRVRARSVVVWPPVEPPPPGARPLHNSVRVLWPHRWEHDKGPDELLALALRHSDELDLRWTILGERFRRAPKELDEFRTRLGARIDHIGFEPDRSAYWAHLRRCDWVLSTARHEFFGVAVVEALLAGCLPWLPQRLSYPELLPRSAHGLSPHQTVEDPQSVRDAIARHLEAAVAANAVARLDSVIEQAHLTVCGGRAEAR